jgi:hypothetical protein
MDLTSRWTVLSVLECSSWVSRHRACTFPGRALEHGNSMGEGNGTSSAVRSDGALWRCIRDMVPLERHRAPLEAWTPSPPRGPEFLLSA